MPELPEARRARMIAAYELSTQDAQTLTASREFADRFEAAARTARNPRRVANVLLSEVAGRLKALGLEQEHSPVSMAGIVMAADLLDENKISSKQMKQIFDVCFEKGEDFPAVLRAREARADHRHGSHREDRRRNHRRQIPSRWSSTARARRRSPAFSSARPCASPKGRPIPRCSMNW